MAVGKVEVMWNIIISELTRVVRFAGKVDEVVAEVREGHIFTSNISRVESMFTSTELKELVPGGRI